MDGYGYSKDLSQELQTENEDVWIFHGNPVSDDLPHGGLGLWAPLRPGHGAGFSSDGQSNQLSDRFGLELTLARRLQELSLIPWRPAFLGAGTLISGEVRE